MKGKTLLIRLAALAFCITLGAVMMVIGRGHTIYLDNKTLEGYNGQDYKAYERVVITVKDEQVAKLGKRERGAATWIGQNFKMTLEITESKGDEPKIQEVSVQLPYDVDGIVINLPAYLAGLPEDAWYSEFVPMVEEDPGDEELPGEGDEFGIGDGDGLEGDLGDI